MGKATLLVVEDNAAIRASLHDLFTLEGFAVVEAEHGREALARLDAGLRPSLIVLDLMMPVMDGWEFLRHLRERPERNLPLVVLTTLSYDADVRLLHERYDVDVLDKSTEIVRLLEIARSHRADMEARREAGQARGERLRPAS